MDKTERNETIENASEQAARQWAERYEELAWFYRVLVIGCGVLCAVAILLAMLVRVLAGLAVAIFVAVAYRVLTAELVKRQTGLRTENRRGCCAVSLLRGEEEIHLPRRLLWLDVTCLSAAGTVTDGERVRVLRLPRSLKQIEEGALDALVALERIEFAGTEEEWQAIGKPEVLPACEIIWNVTTD